MSDGEATTQKTSTFAEIEKDILDVLIRLLGFTVPPIVTFALWRSIDAGSTSPFLYGYVAAFYATTAATVGLPLRDHARKLALVGLFCGATLLALIHHGPLLGLGLVCCVGTLFATIFTGVRGAAAYLGSMVVIFVLFSAELLTPGVDTPQLHEPGVWVRVSMVFTICLVLVATIAHTFVGRLKDALHEVNEARKREELAHNERELRLKQIAASQRLEALGRLAAGVAHDFNNALAIIQVGVDLLSNDALTPDDAQEMLDDMHTAVRGAHATTTQLRAFARGSVDTNGVSRIEPALREFARGVETLFPENIAVDLQIEPTDVSIPLSAGALDQVLLNLVINAHDAGCKRIAIGCHATHERVRIWIEDDGSGMEPETAKQAFDPFFTTKGRLGTGLGLAMVHGVVAQAGGEILIDSEIGRGTRFDIVLPVQTQPLREVELVESSVAGQQRVLLVEDRPELLRAMVRELERAGFLVTPALSLAAVHEVIQERRFDLLCTDGILNDGRASDVISAFFTTHSDMTPVIVCSGYLEEDIFPDDQERQRYHFLAKPYQRRGLATLACAVLNVSPDSQKSTG